MPRKRNGKIDEEIEETFPASDPPAFMGGEVLGAPKGRRTALRRSTGPAPKTRKPKRKLKLRQTAKRMASKGTKRATKRKASR